MKKILITLAALILVVVLSACGANVSTSGTDAAATPTAGESDSIINVPLDTIESPNAQTEANVTQSISWESYTLNWKFEEATEQMLQNINDPTGKYVFVSYASVDGTIKADDINAYCDTLFLTDNAGVTYPPRGSYMSGISFDPTSGAFSTLDEQDSFMLIYDVPTDAEDSALCPVISAVETNDAAVSDSNASLSFTPTDILIQSVDAAVMNGTLSDGTEASTQIDANNWFSDGALVNNHVWMPAGAKFNISMVDNKMIQRLDDASYVMMEVEFEGVSYAVRISYDTSYACTVSDGVVNLLFDAAYCEVYDENGDY